MDQIAAWRRAASVVLCLMLGSCATNESAPIARLDTVALETHRAWWQAYTAGDQAMLAAHTAVDAAAIFGSGARLRRTALIEEAGKNRRATGFTMAWSEESVLFLRPGLAVISGTSTERAGSSIQVFRITTLLDHVGKSDWRTRFIQTTRVAQFAPAVPATVSGRIEEYAGEYLTPKGRAIKMELRDGLLWMVEPDGKGFKLTATGPGLFEPGESSPLNGVLRFVFARDTSGKVVSFSRLTEGHVATFPRAN